MKRFMPTMVAAACAVLVACAPATAQVSLRFTPPDTTIGVGDSCRLSVMLDGPDSVRTIDIQVAYDSTIVRSLGGGAGTLYTTSGHPVFQGFEEDVPGLWHGYAILLAAEVAVQGPGELYTWELEGTIDGVTAIEAIEVHLSTTDGSWFESVSLPPTTLTVGSGPSSVPPRAGGPSFDLSPNPFNPRTVLSGDLPRPGRVEVSVYDLRGRLVAVPWSGRAEAGPLAVPWDGRSSDGTAAPAGIYLFRIDGPGFEAVEKGVLVQ